jgi:RimJ/RimL family protein N-acetyltransferase
MHNLGPIALEGRYVRLEPLRPHHAGALYRAGQAPEIWDWLAVAFTGPESAEAFIAAALQGEAAGAELPFAVIWKETGEVVGSTRYLEIDPLNKSVEIGWTWYSPAVWGTVVNPEAKLLLMQHAFETWGARRVWLKTDAKNLRSQAAIRKLGAQYEGTLRHHRIRRDGSMRDTVIFSVIDPEWPAVKAGLLRRLG